MQSSVFSLLLQAIALTMLAAAVLKLFDVLPPYGVPTIFVLSLAAQMFWKRPWKISAGEVTRLLNQQYSQLEESSQLLLREPESLNQLEALQLKRVAGILAELPDPALIYRSVKMACIALAAALLLTLAVSKVPKTASTVEARREAAARIKPKALPQITSISVSISPPAYTGRKSRKQDELPLEVEDGARVTWTLRTDHPVSRLEMVLNNKDRATFIPLNTARTRWYLQRTLRNSGFYQLKIDTNVSDLYKMLVIRDQPPALRISSPQPYTVIDYGQPQHLQLKVTIADDYRVTAAAIAATLASGKGESVSFKDLSIPLKNFRPNQRAQDLHQVLNLSTLGMKPGDELYFSVSARDNRHQEARSDIYMVTLADTAQLMSLEGLSTGVNLMPEYFRSQRQIIIDTEKLLRERDTLSTEAFRNRSNNLGMDQKLLRLRYGKFLGEEYESEVGEADHDHDEPVRFGDPESMIDAVSHKHDNSEDATFYEPEQKAQLKAVLTEMWKAELQLRTFKPQAALPFEYKALRLLKDLQQKSRAYVGKTALKTTPLKPEKRLTGELSEVSTPISSRVIKATADPQAPIRTTLQLLKAGKKLNADELRHVREAGQSLTAAASRQPEVYLPAVRALQRITNRSSNGADLTTVQKALFKLLREHPRQPAVQRPATQSSLSENYFKKLNNRRN